MNGCARQNGQVSIGLIAVGLIIVAFGAMLLAHNLGVPEVRHLWRQFWPLVFIVAGCAVLLQTGRRAGRWWGLVWIFVGLWIYADIRGWVNVNFWQVFGPTILLILGGSLVWRAVRGPELATGAATNSEFVRSFAILSGAELRPVSEQFQGGELVAVMGGVKLDLTDAHPDTDIVTVNVFAMMGGIEIYVPSDWLVTSKVTSVLGAYVDKRRPSSTPKTKTLIISGMVLMGGVDVKN